MYLQYTLNTLMHVVRLYWVIYIYIYNLCDLTQNN